MRAEKKEVVIAGAGLPSLLLALKIAEDHPQNKILILEKNAELGGMFRSFDYGEHGFFDHGMHIIYETCIPAIDDVIGSVLDKDQWIFLEGNRKDIAGIYYNNQLQKDTPYVDFRNLKLKNRLRYTGGFFYNLALTLKGEPSFDNAEEALRWRFGKLVSNEVFEPILRKLYSRNLTELAPFATQLLAMNRIALFDKKVMLKLMKSDAIRARVAYPDQLNLPNFRPNNQRGLYPKKFGMFRVMNAIEKKLNKYGVKIQTSADIKELQVEGKTLKSVHYVTRESGAQTVSADHLYWGAGTPPLAMLLKMPTRALKIDKNPPGRFVNLIFDTPPNMGELYYFYCFEPGFQTFRVTRYGNYCADADEKGLYRVCIELWPQNEEEALKTQPLEVALSELKKFGVITDKHRLVFSAVEIQAAGFPLPTVGNISNHKIIRDFIVSQNISNITPIGALAEEGVFFLKDVLIDTFAKAKLRGHIHESN
ncbi:MAG: NAD(P)-binding protein [Oligoflexia bacterium]|nr:NAD(P)-binding protein [Oligoflexia bacterium]